MSDESLPQIYVCAECGCGVDPKKGCPCGKATVVQEHAKESTMIIPEGGETSPSEIGLYVAYLEVEGEKLEDNFIDTQPVILTWQKGVWYYPGSDIKYRGRVHAWAGPLQKIKIHKAGQEREALTTWYCNVCGKPAYPVQGYCKCNREG